MTAGDRLKAGLLQAMVLPIRLYRVMISPLLPPRCRYVPSCSAYALEAILRHGPLRGPWLALGRLARCHPWGGSGFDPVPPARDAELASPHVHQQDPGHHSGHRCHHSG